MVPLVQLIQTALYSPLLLFAFFVGMYLLWKQAKEEYYDLPQLFDHVVVAMIWGVFSSRAAFILTRINEFGVDLIKWISLYQYPGYIGIVGLVLGFFVLARKSSKSKWNVFEVLDFAAIASTTTLVLLEVANFVGGAGFGTQTSLPVGVRFPGLIDARHPVQLYAALLFLLLAFLLRKFSLEYRTYFWYRVNKRTAQPGFVFSAFVIGYSLINLVVQPVSVSMLEFQGVAAEYVLYPVLLGLGVGLLWIRSGRGLPFRAK